MRTSPAPPTARWRRTASIAVHLVAVVGALALVLVGPPAGATSVAPTPDIGFSCNGSGGGSSVRHFVNHDGQPHALFYEQVTEGGALASEDFVVPATAPGDVWSYGVTQFAPGQQLAVRISEGGVLLSESSLMEVDLAEPDCWKDLGPAPFGPLPQAVPPVIGFTPSCFGNPPSALGVTIHGDNVDGGSHELVVHQLLDGAPATEQTVQLLPGDDLDTVGGGPFGSTVQYTVTEGGSLLAESPVWHASATPPCYAVDGGDPGPEPVPPTVAFTADCSYSPGDLHVVVQMHNVDDLLHEVVVTETVDGVGSDTPYDMQPGESDEYYSNLYHAGETVLLTVTEGGSQIAASPVYVVDDELAACGDDPVDPAAPTVAFDEPECDDGGVVFGGTVTNVDGGAHSVDVYESVDGGPFVLDETVVLAAGQASGTFGDFKGPGHIVQFRVEEGGVVLATSAVWDTDDACSPDDGGSQPPTVAFEAHCDDGGVVFGGTVTNVDGGAHSVDVFESVDGGPFVLDETVVLAAGQASGTFGDFKGPGHTVQFRVEEGGVVLATSPVYDTDAILAACDPPTTTSTSTTSTTVPSTTSTTVPDTTSTTTPRTTSTTSTTIPTTIPFGDPCERDCEPTTSTTSTTVPAPGDDPCSDGSMRGARLQAAVIEEGIVVDPCPPATVPSEPTTAVPSVTEPPGVETFSQTPYVPVAERPRTALPRTGPVGIRLFGWIGLSFLTVGRLVKAAARRQVARRLR